MSSFQEKLQAKMCEMGWKFYPFGPEDWEWMKFDDEGRRIARQGDPVYNSDLAYARERILSN